MLELTSHFGGQLLLDKGLLSPDQLAAALRIHLEQPSLRLTDALLMFGFLSFGSLHLVLREIHPDQPVGHQLVKRGKLRSEHLEEALAIQEKEGGELPDILVQHGWCEPAAIRRAQTAVERRRAWAARWQSLGKLFPAYAH